MSFSCQELSQAQTSICLSRIVDTIQSVSNNRSNISLENVKLVVSLGGDGVYILAGAFVYADDLKLLTPTVHALDILTNIYIEYAAKYDILFNGKKV